jgi:transposase-like protein
LAPTTIGQALGCVKSQALIRFPLSLRKVEDLLFERGIDVCHQAGDEASWQGRYYHH